DGNPNSKWLVFTSTGTLTYELSEAAAITGYSITSANDAPDRDPKDFAVQGSTDGETWTDLDIRTGQSWATEESNNRQVTTTYELTERSADYTHYRLQITANNGDNDLQLADWDLLDSQRETPPSPMVTEVANGPTSSSTAPHSASCSAIATHAPGQADIPCPGQWNSLTVCLSASAGRTVETIVFTYDQPDAPAGTPVTGYLDDISIVPTTPLDTSEGL